MKTPVTSAQYKSSWSKYVNGIDYVRNNYQSMSLSEAYNLANDLIKTSPRYDDAATNDESFLDRVMFLRWAKQVLLNYVVLKKYNGDVQKTATETFNAQFYPKEFNDFNNMLDSIDQAVYAEDRRRIIIAQKAPENGLLGFESKDADIAFADAVNKVGTALVLGYVAYGVVAGAGAGAAATGAESGAGIAGAATESGTLAGSTGLLGSTTTASAAGAGITTAEVAEGGGLLAALGSAAEKIGSQVVENKILGAITPAKPAATPAKTTTPVVTQTENQNSLLKYLTPIATTLLLLL